MVLTIAPVSNLNVIDLVLTNNSSIQFTSSKSTYPSPISSYWTYIKLVFMTVLIVTFTFSLNFETSATSLFLFCKLHTLLLIFIIKIILHFSNHGLMNHFVISLILEKVFGTFGIVFSILRLEKIYFCSICILHQKMFRNNCENRWILQ